jgi:DNA-binding MarR family transcriptional regulator
VTTPADSCEELPDAAEHTPENCLQRVDLNWLLHRAAQQLGETMENQATAHGITIRAHIVLTALVQADGTPLSQLGLGQRLGVDKTTMTALLDKLERKNLVIRAADPNDRRARIPQITSAGRKLQAVLARELDTVEDQVLGALNSAERDQLRELLRRIITVDGVLAAPPAGSCL